MENKIYTVEEFQENFDDLFERVENGESFMISSGSHVCVIAPLTQEIVEDLESIHLTHNDAP